MDHSRIVQLAQFDINTDKLQDSVLESQKRLIDLNKEIYKSVQAMAQLQKSIDAANKTSDALNNSNKKTGDAYAETNKNVIELMESEKKLIQETQKLRAERDKLQVDYNNQKALLQEVKKKNNEVAVSENNVADAVAREVNTRKQAKQNTKELNKIKDELNVNNKEEAALLDQINEKVNRNNQLLVESGSAREQRINNIGKYSEGIQDAFANLDIMNGGLTGFIQRSNQAGGAGELLKGTFTEIKTGVTGITKSLLASPIGLVLGLIGGITLLGKEFIEYNAEIAKTDKLIRGITKTTAEETTQIRLLGSAMKETFGTDIEETVQTAKVLVNEFGISYEEAMNQIREGLIRGQEGNKQYLDSLREYSTFFKQAGYSVEEFRSIVSAGYDLGIYNDKLPDALKEFGLSITEQTKASRDALVNAFGTEFTESLLKRVKEGSIGVNDALKEISEQAKNSNLDLKQQAELTASVFRGAGEDAGGALKIFEAVNKAYADQNRELTELEQKTKDLSDANIELGKAKDLALNSDAVNEFKKDFELLWISAKTYFYQYISVFNYNMLTLKNGLFALRDTFVQVFNQIKTILGNFDITDPLKSLRELQEIDFQKQFAGNVKAINDQQKETRRLAAEEKARQDQNALNAGQEEARRKAAEEAKAKADKLDKAASDAAIKRIDLMIAKQKEQLDLWIAQQGDKARTMQEELSLQEQISKKSIAILDNELKNKKISQEKYDLEVLKLQQNTVGIQRKIAVELLDEELEKIVKTNASKLEQTKYFTSQQLKAEQDRLDKINKAEQENNSLKLFLGDINQKQFNDNKKALDVKYEEEKTALQKNYEQQRFQQQMIQQAVNFQYRLSQLESQVGNEFDIKRLKEEENFQKELATFAEQNKIKFDLDNDNYISQQEIQMQRDLLQTEYNNAKNEEEKNVIQTKLMQIDTMVSVSAQNQKKIDQEVLNAKLSGYAGAFGALANFLGKESAAGKAAALAQALINTYQGITAGVALGFPLSIPAVAMASLTGFAAVKNIVSTKTPSVSGGGSPKMAKGGLTEIGGKLHSQGGTKFVGEDGTRFEAEKGELIGVLNRSAAAHFMNYNNSFLNNGSKTYPNYFANGGIVGLQPSNNAVVLQNLFGNFDTGSITEAVRQGAMQGTQQGSYQGSLEGSQQGSYQGSQVVSQQGISQLSSDRSMQGKSNF